MDVDAFIYMYSSASFLMVMATAFVAIPLYTTVIPLIFIILCITTDGDLAVSRALGDFFYKNRTDLPAEDQKVSSKPEIVIHERQGLSIYVCMYVCMYVT